MGLLRRGDLVGLELLLGLSRVDVKSFGGRAMVVLVSRDDVPDGGDDDDTHEDNYGIVHAITGDGDRSGHAEQWNGEKTPRCKGLAILDMSPRHRRARGGDQENLQMETTLQSTPSFPRW